MLKRRTALILASAFALAGCHKEITSLARKEAATEASEAQFAMSVNDFARAQGLYAKAAELCPDTGDYWLGLGMARVHLGDKSAARSAYKSALGVFRDRADQVDESEPVLKAAYVMLLLGRADDAKSYLAKMSSKHPDDRRLASFIERHALDTIAADPATKELTP